MRLPSWIAVALPISAVLSLALVVLAACGRPYSPPAAAAGSGLAVTGALSFQVPTVIPQQPCGATGSAYHVELDFQQGGRPWAISIELIEYHGPGSYPAPPDRVSIRTLGTGSGAPVFFSGTAGTTVVNTDEQSGTLDEQLTGQAGTAHLTGKWSCH